MSSDLKSTLENALIGQPGVVDRIVPYIKLYQKKLAAPDRPIGNFLLLGPTGSGKTHVVECLAEALHGCKRTLIKIDCGELALDHQVARLTAAPAGYIGHKETPPLITQARLTSVMSQKNDISIVLFDEIEKASPTVLPILLSIMDKATMSTGDNNKVNFERSLIFMTSNLGARGIMDKLAGGIGLPTTKENKPYIAGIAEAAAKKHFSPEFYNRLDEVIAYRPLDKEDLRAILERELGNVQMLLHSRLGANAVLLRVSAAAKEAILAEACVPGLGARELKRVIQKRVVQPLADIDLCGPVVITATCKRNQIVLRKGELVDAAG